jgi:AraC family transcriptional regulator of arabinose operon
MSGFKHFYTPRALDTPELSIRGIGLREGMRPSFISRPTGFGDYLLMLFHDPATAETRPGAPPVLHPPESLMIWTPGTGQYYGNRQAPYSHTWIHAHGTRLEHILATLPAPLPLNRAFPLGEAGAGGFPRCLHLVHQELVTGRPPDAVLVGNLLENCLRETARELARPAADEPGADISEALLAVRAHIGSHSAEPLTLPDLARMAGLSVPHFCATFRAAFGLSPVQCLIQHRLMHAAYLLADRGVRIQEIARRVGYEDAFHFSKMFRRRFGQSPRAFRAAPTRENGANS